MQKNLKVERLYSLGDYKSIRISDEIIEIPDEFVLKEEVLESLRYLQFITIEIAYRRYLTLAKKAQTFTSEQINEAIGYLEQEKLTTLAELKDLMLKE